MDAKLALIELLTTLGFNPRARDGRESRFSCDGPTSGSFNPRARDGREYSAPAKPTISPVSIHAPVMDAKKVW